MRARPLHRSRRSLFAAGAAAAALLLGPQCTAPRSPPNAADQTAGLAAWNVVYRVLQHPRCANCHPSGDVPLQGDDGRPHAQNVQRGSDGKGRYALRCDACHQTQNLPGAHLPPGAPNWQLPRPSMALPFAGRSPRELARQLQDPAQNGGRTTAQLLEHVSKDPLVLWGWDPGPGRAPVPVPHAEFTAAMRAWIDGGCAVPAN